MRIKTTALRTGHDVLVGLDEVCGVEDIVARGGEDDVEDGEGAAVDFGGR